MRLAVVNSCHSPSFASRKPSFDAVHGNTGNAVIYKGLENQLHQTPDFVIPSLFSASRVGYCMNGSVVTNNNEISEALGQCDATILILQDLIRQDAYVSSQELASSTELLSCANNLFIFSLGSNTLHFNRNITFSEIAKQFFSSLPGHVMEFTRFLLDASILISVRGHITRIVLEHINKVPKAQISVDGCPSLSGRSLDHHIYNNRKRHGHLNPWFATGGLFGIKSRKSLLHTLYVAQEKYINSPLYLPILHHRYPYAGLALQMPRGRKIFLDPSAWTHWLQDLNCRGQDVFFCETRLHGLIQALTAGISGMLLSGD